MRYKDLFENDSQEVYAPAEFLADNYTGGEINISNDEITTLKGLPNHVTGFLYCGANPLKSLEGCPQIIDGDFNCAGSFLLTSLKGGPVKVGGDYCVGGNLVNLEGCPQELPQGFIYNPDMNHFDMTGGPHTVHGDCDLGATVCDSITDISKFAHAPKLIGGHCTINFSNAAGPVSISKINQYFPEIRKSINVWSVKGVTNILSLLAIKGLTRIRFQYQPELADIMNKHLPMGKKGMMACQTELIKAGFKEQAKL